jgi:hypothetical protein
MTKKPATRFRMAGFPFPSLRAQNGAIVNFTALLA